MRVLIALLASAVCFLAPAILRAQGSLTPPGPPNPSMKTLDQVEPRTPINAAKTPGDGDSKFKISNPGTYYLTADYVPDDNKSGIEIAAHQVTIDLQGYRMVGLTGMPGSGIRVTLTNASDITIRNGTLLNWKDYGVNASLAKSIRLENLNLINCGKSGVIAGKDAEITNCKARDNDEHGFNLQGTAIVTGCSAHANTASGFFAADAVVFADCLATDNGGNGFQAQDGGMIRNCTARGNTYHGINAVYGNVVDCTCVSNQGYGLYGNASRIQGCLASKNALDGIMVKNNCMVVQNQCSDNLNQGIHVWDTGNVFGQGNRIENNHTSDNKGAGIFVHISCKNNLILNNSTSGPYSGIVLFNTDDDIMGTTVLTTEELKGKENDALNYRLGN